MKPWTPSTCSISLVLRISETILSSNFASISPTKSCWNSTTDMSLKIRWLSLKKMAFRRKLRILIHQQMTTSSLFSQENFHFFRSSMITRRIYSSKTRIWLPASKEITAKTHFWDSISSKRIISLLFTLNARLLTTSRASSLKIKTKSAQKSKRFTLSCLSIRTKIKWERPCWRNSRRKLMIWSLSYRLPPIILWDASSLTSKRCRIALIHHICLLKCVTLVSLKPFKSGKRPSQQEKPTQTS